MKVIITFLLVSISLCCFAQDGDIINLSNKPLYIIDGDSVSDFKNIGSNDIFRIEVLKDAQAAAKYGDSAKNGVILITTKKYALKQVQNKLSRFSKSYYRFIGRYPEITITFLVDGNTKNLESVYNMTEESIDTVKFESKNGNAIANILIKQ